MHVPLAMLQRTCDFLDSGGIRIMKVFAGYCHFSANAKATYFQVWLSAGVRTDPNPEGLRLTA
jgi:hypothetical protein